MRNFHRVATGIKVDQLVHSIARQPTLWNRYNFRTTFPNTPFAENDDIVVRYPAPEACEEGIEHVINADRSEWYPVVGFLPELADIVLDVMRFSRAYALDRLLITRLPPGGQILAHTDDRGSYVGGGDVERLHLVLQGLPGSLFSCGDETVCMLTGELWWFNPHMEHSAVNNSIDDRIHLLIDLSYWP